MATANERLQHEAVAHAIDLDRYSTFAVRKIISLLNKVDADLVAQIAEALERLPPASFTVQRLKSLLESVKAVNEQAFDALNVVLAQELKDLAAYEAGYQLQLFRSVIPAQVVIDVGVASVNVRQIYAAAMSQPMRGRLLKEWVDGLLDGDGELLAPGLKQARMVRINDAISIGYTEGQTIDEIVRRIRGTRAKGYSDGVIDITRRDAASVVRTAVSHVAGVTRDRFYGGNSDIIAAVGWVSTLDSKTTREICMPRDGKNYDPVTHKPKGHKYPWLDGPGRAHWNCRSVSIAVLKSLREMGVDVDDFAPAARASLDGQVPASLTFGEWLKDQSVQRQDDVLGRVRAEMYRKGDLSIDRFFSDKGRWLTLDELRARDAKLFIDTVL